MASQSLVVGSLGAVSQRDGVSLAESFLNVDAVLVIDVSGSMGTNDAPGGISRHEAAEAELRRLQESLPGKVAVIAFSDNVQFCPCGVPPRIDGSTNLAAALRFVHPVDGLARIIVISDGQPDSEEKALAEARKFKSRIDVVYIGPEIGDGRSFLQKLAELTGGTYSKSQAPGLLTEAVQRLMLVG